MEWEAVRSVATVLSMLIAALALALSLAVYRRSNGAELRQQISSGDLALSERLDEIETAVHAGNRLCERRLTEVETTVKHGINRNDIDQLNARLAALMEKLGSVSSTVESMGKHLDRVDSYLRKQG